ncbi:glutathione S-transferase [Comamonadaceae bacterium OH2545_COT-014]|nr:glutathione S-transferase [Comamonadaceae bacterium OH2545_COT-014]
MRLPVLYTFRRCPYAMRARWALHVAGVALRQCEVALRDKPPAMLAVSPKGTVPVLVLPDGAVIDESLDIMRWALARHDPEGWLTPQQGSLEAMLALIASCEQDFKPHLDRYKYPVRYRCEWAGADEPGFSQAHFEQGLGFLHALSQRLSLQGGAAGEGGGFGLFGPQPALADIAIVPFVRQMARHDPARFAQRAPAEVGRWMQALLARDDFESIMRKPAAGA